MYTSKDRQYNDKQKKKIDKQFQKQTNKQTNKENQTTKPKPSD
jgi:hypothetical protein